MTAANGITLLEQHPLSAAFPSMPEDELQALAEDIRRHGQREPGVLFEGMVLDGWHRYLACQRAEVEFRAVEFDGDNPVSFVLSRNLIRRHLTGSQRAAAVVAAHNWKPLGANQHYEKEGRKPLPTLTEKQMAEEAEVSTRTIRQAKAAHSAGLGEAVKEGRVSAERAAAVAALPPRKRAQAVKAIEAGEEPPAPKAKSKGDEAKLRAELIDLQGKYADLLEKNAELADVAQELNDKLETFSTTEPDEQQKLIADLQLKLRKKDAEIDRQRVQLRDANNENNALKREVKRLQRRDGVGQ